MQEIEAKPHTGALVGIHHEDACPVERTYYSYQKTAKMVEAAEKAVSQDEQGIWHIRSFALARTVLRTDKTKQAGFNGELLEKLPQRMRRPILFQEGREHQQQRKQIARFFTPKAVSANYRKLMERQGSSLLKKLRRGKQADLSALSMEMAISVAAEVVGLTNSLLPGMSERLDAFLQHETPTLSRTLPGLMRLLANQWRLLRFFLFDVQPAIRARRKKRREDVISHLLDLGYSDSEILTECVTYVVAGMVTTREFISVATWHFLEHPALRARYLLASETERYAMLQEILRVEPVVGHLLRRATEDITLECDGETIQIPAGALIDIDVYKANADKLVTGEQPLSICPARELHGERLAPELLSFGDGHHRCPGSFIAIQETDMLLRRLLALDDLRIKQKPTISWNAIVNGYELRKFIIAVD